ncbi:MAG: zinc-binding alcohol dehydrogenase family protein [Burkholderiaceae bacterium]|nr:zinc-binding alcohol dehydrogenase family protein [Burkholderiaceae bacterium]
MKAAIVEAAGKAPVYGDFEEPKANAGENIVSVTAAALTHLTKGRASGSHYSSAGTYPFIAGVDGVGRLEDGKRVYFVLPRTPFGGMAEKSVVSAKQCVPIPDKLDDVMASALANPGMSSWAAFVERAKLKAGETVLINGATGISGRLAIQIAKHLGAKKVIATGRNVDALHSLAAIGADVTIPLIEDEEALESGFKEQFAEGVDVVLDYLWGKSAERLLIAGARAGKDAVPIRFVQIGSMSGTDITLPAAVLRSSAIELMGSGIGSVSPDRLIKAIGEVFAAAIPARFTVATQVISLSEVERAWKTDDSRKRIVFSLA